MPHDLAIEHIYMPLMSDQNRWVPFFHCAWKGGGGCVGNILSYLASTQCYTTDCVMKKCTQTLFTEKQSKWSVGLDEHINPKTGPLLSMQALHIDPQSCKNLLSWLFFPCSFKHERCLLLLICLFHATLGKWRVKVIQSCGPKIDTPPKNVGVVIVLIRSHPRYIESFCGCCYRKEIE